jgi:MYXO-CTERM domain-containing protein
MRAAYAHLVLTHIPLIGTIVGTLILALGLIFRSDSVLRVGFAALIVSALLAIPTFLTGRAAEHPIERFPGIAEVRVEHHEEVAIFGLTSSIAVGLIALGALVAYRRRRVPRPFALGLLILSLVPFGALVWTANSGGKIRHTEIFPVTATETEES